MKKSTVIVLVLTALGIVLLAIGAVLEARSYPWQHRLGMPAQDAAAMPEPTPIVPDEEEAVVVYLEAVETLPPMEDAESPAAPEVLPGAEEDAGEVQPVENAPAQKQYTVIGTLKIPALKVSQNILEGTGKELKYGVGRLTLSAYPGERGNCVIAGHRPYPFRYLDMLVTGDVISIRFNGMTYTYNIYESFEVLPTETWVLNRVKEHPYTLTLITCTPYMVSSHRLIVRAELTAIDGVPFEDPAAAGGVDAVAEGEGEGGKVADGGEGVAAPPSDETGGAGGFEGPPDNASAAEGSPLDNAPAEGSTQAAGSTPDAGSGAAAESPPPDASGGAGQGA